MSDDETPQCPYRRQKYECINIFSKLSSARCSICMSGQNADAIEKQTQSIELLTSAVMNMSMDKMEEEVDGNKR